MRFIHLSLLYFILSSFSSNPVLENPPSSPIKILKHTTSNPTTADDVVPGAINILFQSKDAGQTWQDISNSLPNSEPEDFFVGESDLYLRAQNVMYRSKSNLKTPVWEKESGLDPQGASIAFNRSGVMAYNYGGKIYKNIPGAGTWLPIYSNFRQHSMRTIFGNGIRRK